MDSTDTRTSSSSSSVTTFEQYLELAELFLKRRATLVENIEGILNAKGKAPAYLQDRALLAQRFDECFGSQAIDSLEEAQAASGFRRREVHYLENDITHPAEMAVRAFHCWQQTRWPGGAGRTHYAHTLFNVYVLRYLTYLSMRIWDDDGAAAGARLGSLQRVLDELWKSSPPNQPRLVRDARWLIPLAQSPITDELAPYFEVARKVRESLPEADRVEIQKAHVRMQGAHLTSQVRHYSSRDGVPVDDLSVVMRTRSSNALDFALTVQGLVDVLQTYELALQSGDETLRLSMAGAVFQGISPDPELFLHRIPLLFAYCMIEDVLVAPNGYSELGEQHVRLHARYAESITRLIPKLRDDLPRFRPVAGGYSSYGMLYGTPSNLVDLMAVKAMQHDAESRFSLEDVFSDSGDSAAKLAWVNGWRALPHVNPETQRAFHLPQDFAQTGYERMVREFHRSEVPPTGRLRIEPGSEFATDLPEKYFGSYDTAQLLRDRHEGHFLLSYQATQGWVAFKKSILTEVLGAGRDVRIAGLPPEAEQVLRLMCADLVAA